MRFTVERAVTSRTLTFVIVDTVTGEFSKPFTHCAPAQHVAAQLNRMGATSVNTMTDMRCNTMVATGDPHFAWKCADCGRVFGTD